MQCFFKVYPKFMAVAQDQASCLEVRLRYTVEQYGVLTGPFEINMRFRPEDLAHGADPWHIISNTRDKYNQLFVHFFACLEQYLLEMHGMQPFEDVRSGHRKHFEMYFPDIHYDYVQRSFEMPKDGPRQDASASAPRQ